MYIYHRDLHSFPTRRSSDLDTLGEAVTKVIQLVCENLGWEWGAYWALEPDRLGAQQLACRHFWHGPQYPLNALIRRSEEHTSELQSHSDLVCRLLLEKKKKK